MTGKIRVTPEEIPGAEIPEVRRRIPGGATTDKITVPKAGEATKIILRKSDGGKSPACTMNLSPTPRRVTVPDGADRAC